MNKIIIALLMLFNLYCVSLSAQVTVDLGGTPLGKVVSCGKTSNSTCEELTDVYTFNGDDGTCTVNGKKYPANMCSKVGCPIKQVAAKVFMERGLKIPLSLKCEGSHLPL